MSTQADQIRLLSDSYGLERAAPYEVVDAILYRQSRNIEFWRERKARSSHDFGSEQESERIEEVIQ